MKTIYFFLFAIIIAFYACSKENDYYADNNLIPQISFVKIADTANYSSQVYDTTIVGADYYLNVFCKDEDQNLTPGIYVITSEQTDTLDPKEVLSYIENYSKNDTIAHLKFDQEFTGIVSFCFKDSYNATGEGKLFLKVYENSAPVANFSVVNSKTHDAMEISINAASSYDREEKWGAGIVLYEYKISTITTIQTELNSIDYIFSDPGNYSIKLRVKDGKDVWSETVEKFVQVTE